MKRNLKKTTNANNTLNPFPHGLRIRDILRNIRSQRTRSRSAKRKISNVDWLSPDGLRHHSINLNRKFMNTTTSNEAIIRAYLGPIDRVEFRVKHISELDMMIWYHESCEPVLVQYMRGDIMTSAGTHLMTVREAMDRYECFRIWNECPTCHDDPSGMYFYAEGDEEYFAPCEHYDRPVPTK